MQQKTLSNLEREVMNIIWQKKECTVKDILSELQKKRKIAYTTVATIAQRLEKKGIVTKREVGKAYIYKSKMTRDLYAKRVAQAFIKSFVRSFGSAAVVSFAQSIEYLPANKRDSLLKLLKQDEKNKH